jgi:hypothetical protein
MHGKKASFLARASACSQCVKTAFNLVSEGLACDELEYREVHVYSFTDSSKNSPLSSCG